MKAILKDGIYIPIRQVTEHHMERVERRFEKYVYKKESVCESCDYFAERPSDTCNECANFGGHFKLHRRETWENGKTYLRLPYGDRVGVRKIFGDDIEVVDKTPDVPMKKPFKFTGTLKPEQVPAVKAMMKTRSGVLKSPPRSGKCVDGSTIIYTQEGLVRIDSLFENVRLSTKSETTVSAPKGLKIQTPEGLKPVSHLYSKIVDRTVCITTAFGRSVRGTENHPVMVAREGCQLEWVPLSDVKVGDFVVAHNRKDSWHGHQRMLMHPSNDLRKYLHKNTTNIGWYKLPTMLTYNLAALMGMLMADGRLGNGNSISFCNTHKAKQSKFYDLWNSCFPQHSLKRSRDEKRALSIGTCSKQIKLFFEHCCGFEMVNAGLKSFPKILMTAPRETVLHFLAGYMSCDGEITKAGAVFSSASFKYTRQLSKVLMGLGYVNTVGTHPVPVQLSHVTLGDRIGQYGCLKMKRPIFDALLKELPFMLRRLPDTDPRSIHQSDVVPFMRKHLSEMSQTHRLSRGVLGTSWKAENGDLVPFKKVGLLLRDKRGAGRNPHLNRATVFQSFGSVIEQIVGWSTLKKVFPAEHARLLDYAQLSFEQVVEHIVIKKAKRVYDVCVPGPHAFYGNGIVNHNTVMAACYVAQKELKTLILASQLPWLNNFYETFVGSDTQTALTNVKTKRIGFPKKLEDFEKFDVCLCTYQTFIHKKGKRLLKKIRKMFSIVIVDEVQDTAALEFSRIVGTFVARHKIGLSGTPERKDTLEYIIYKIFGTVFYESKVQRLRPRVEVVNPPFVGKLPSSWTYAVGALEKNPQRLKHIAQTAVKDIKAGHLVYIPLARVPVMKALTKAINRLAGKEVAVEYHGRIPKKVREKTVEQLRRMKFKCAVGNTRMLSTGMNIPRASMLYQVSPSSNLPKADQRFSRVLTPWPNKPQPVIKYWLDQIDLVRSCMRNEHFGCLVPLYKPIIDPVTRSKLDAYFKNRKTRQDDDGFSGGVL